MADSVSELYDRIGERPVVPDVTPEGLRSHLAQTYREFETPIPAEAVLDDVMGMLTKQQVQPTHPRYFGLFNPSMQPASVVADALVAAANPQICVRNRADRLHHLGCPQVAVRAHGRGHDLLPPSGRRGPRLCRGYPVHARLDTGHR